jgi:hypothetical protein
MMLAIRGNARRRALLARIRAMTVLTLRCWTCPSYDVNPKIGDPDGGFCASCWVEWNMTPA